MCSIMAIADLVLRTYQITNHATSHGRLEYPIRINQATE